MATAVIITPDPAEVLPRDASTIEDDAAKTLSTAEQHNGTALTATPAKWPATSNSSSILKRDKGEEDPTALIQGGALLANGKLSSPFPDPPPDRPLRTAQVSLGEVRQRDRVVDPLQPLHEDGPVDVASPPGSRSVQFFRDTSHLSDGDYLSAKQDVHSTDAEGENRTRERRGLTLLTKLKSLAPPGFHGHGRSQSGYTIGGDSINDRIPSEPLSPENERGTSHTGHTLEEEGNGAEADLENSTSDESPSLPTRRSQARRHRRRRSDEGTQTAPTTPKASTHPWNSRRGQLPSPRTPMMENNPPHVPIRRATITDVPEEGRLGMSEDEGRQRMAPDWSWRRPSFFGKGHSQTAHDSVRPSNFRRLTTLGQSSHNAASGSPGPRRRGLDWNPSMSASRWRALKAGLRMIGQKRKEEHKVDHAKSAELLAELAAGTPAALIVASMFQRDDHGNKRIPVLLEQLKVTLSDSKRVETKVPGDKHQIFRIELEYGSGLTRMKWVVHRTLRDFANLHLRYKLQNSSEKYKHLHVGEDTSRTRIPRFPRTAFPYLRGVRGLGSDEEDEGDEVAEEEPGGSATEGTGTGAGRRLKRKRKRPPLGTGRRSSFPFRSDSMDTGADGEPGTNNPTGRREPYAERQRKKLELYLQQLIRFLMFRADSNRLCKFLELSSLGIRLAAEGSYHGKEGFLVIQSSKGIDFRKAWHPSFLAKRHTPKWFLVRHSYIVCVDSPEEMNIYDVFLVDPEFSVNSNKGRLLNKEPDELDKVVPHTTARPQHHSLKLRNSERKLKLLAKNERQLLQFEDSIKYMKSNTVWSKPHRFGSFAPVRHGVSAQWLVDGRDYFWNVSRAISMAKDVIYIHDWWLSPELYMRRPAAISRKWRLDRLLQRKASEGVKVFVILYRNINSAVPIDSSYTKFSLLDLHPNVFVQRSPNQFRQNTFFWAHHEKVCVVDHTVAFVGGLDLCFGRWDTPQHSVSDDKLTGFEQADMPKDADHCQLWPGKDYSNPRVQDFYALDKPYEEMYDRTVVPRMPWHDISMQIVGQPARDLTRHFVQRWNYILRQRKPTRPTPFLLPPPDFNPADLEGLGLDGTCEVQILRSCCWWSIGTPDKTEHSIMNAYVKMIEQSEHFVYIENQFFITSCEMEGTIIENMIGDALVNRAIRAATNGEDWRAVILIPLMPGFQNTVDSQDGTSIRLIMQCQYRSICRGETSIFGRLRAHDIEPEDYIQFYSLRSWGKIGQSKMLVTEELYIHAKCMIVDDRIAIIGSANINERSMLGSRDSECAAIIRDTDMLWSTMNGKPYLVGRFPHTLRMRLMREHLGLDVDEIMEEEREQEFDQLSNSPPEDQSTMRRDSDAQSHISTMGNLETEQMVVSSQNKVSDEVIAKNENIYSFNHDVDWEQANNPHLRSEKRLTEDKRVTGNAEHRKDVEGKGPDHMLDEPNPEVNRGRDSAVVGGDREVLVVDVAPEGKGTLVAPLPHDKRNASGAHSPNSGKISGDCAPLPPSRQSQTNSADLPMTSQLPALPSTDDADIDGPCFQTRNSKSGVDLITALTAEMTHPTVDKDCMKDPLSDSFYLDTWQTVAENNTKLFRHVFRCMPDSEVKSWKEYKEYVAYAERMAQAQGGVKSKSRVQHEAQGKSGPVGVGSAAEKLATLSPIGDAIDGTRSRLGSVLKAPEKKQEILTMDNVAEWAAEANRAQAERQPIEKDNEDEKSALSGVAPDEVVDEKADLRPPTKASDDMPTTPTVKITTTSPQSADPEKTQIRLSSPPSNTTDMASKSSTVPRRRRRGTTRSSRREFLASDDLMEKAEAEELMSMVQGNLVVWPYDWYVVVTSRALLPVAPWIWTMY